MSRIKVGWLMLWVVSVGVVGGWAQPAQSFVVKDVQIEGAKEVPLPRVLAQVTFKAGDTISAEDIRTSAQQIMQLGFFTNISPDVKQEEGGAVVVFRLSETPVIRAIQISGNRQYQLSWRALGLKIPFFWNILKSDRIIEILKKHDVVPYQIVNLNDVNEALGDVKKEYEDKGYYWISVDQDRMLRSLQTGNTLIIPILELGVEEVRVEGLSPQLEDIARGLISIPLHEPPKLAALQRTFAALNNSIFFEPFDPSSEENLQLLPGSKVNTLILDLKPHPRALLDQPFELKEVTFSGNTAFSDERLRQQLPAWDQAPLDNLGVLRVLQGVYGLYHHSGFSNMDLSVEPQPGGVLRVSVEEGTVHEVNVRINYEGGYTQLTLAEGLEPQIAHFTQGEGGAPVQVERTSGHTKPYVVLNALQVHPRDLFNENRLRDTVRTLLDLGYFNDVQVHVEPLEGSSQSDVSFSVVEKTKLGSINGAVTLADNGLVGKVSVAEKNLLGTGQDVSVDYDRGIFSATKTNWSLNYSTHGFFPEYKDFTVKLFQSFERPSVEQELARQGGELSLTYPLSSTTDLVLRGRHENFQQCLRGGVSCEPPGLTDSVTLGWTHDTRDTPVFPMEGGRQSIEVEKAGGFSVGTEFTKVDGSLVQHFPTFKDQNVALRLYGGAGAGLPPQERFSLGGPATVRGLPSQRVNQFLVLNAEYRVKWLDQFSTALFMDWGLGSANGKDEGQALRGTLGVEARVSLPFLGMTRFALAWKLARPVSLIPQFSFGFGPMF